MGVVSPDRCHCIGYVYRLHVYIASYVLSCIYWQCMAVSGDVPGSIFYKYLKLCHYIGLNCNLVGCGLYTVTCRG